MTDLEVLKSSPYHIYQSYISFQKKSLSLYLCVSEKSLEARNAPHSQFHEVMFELQQTMLKYGNYDRLSLLNGTGTSTVRSLGAYSHITMEETIH